MNYCEIKDCDIANGDGVRVALFVSGCDKHCKGCFNPSTWDPRAGKEFSEETYDLLRTMLIKPYIKGLTLLGGDPFYPGNRSDISNLLRLLRSDIKEFSTGEKDIWMYTGYLYEDLLEYEKEERQKFGCQIANGEVHIASRPILQYIDVLVDGPFVEEQKDLSLKFRGSSNQRIIDVKKSMCANNVILYTD